MRKTEFSLKLSEMSRSDLVGLLRFLVRSPRSPHRGRLVLSVLHRLEARSR